MISKYCRISCVVRLAKFNPGGLRSLISLSTPTDADAAALERLIGAANVIRDPDTLEPHNVDWFKSFLGNSKLLLKPGSVDEVSAVLQHCNQNRTPVCIQGGNTGLVGGQVATNGEVILNMARLNEIVSFDDNSGVLAAQAGCILEACENYVSDKGHVMPLDLAAKGSCHIGGNIATNAGGIRLVLANGSILDIDSSVRKDNTGFHLPHIFVGSEGLLGVVTHVRLTCPSKPRANCVAFLGTSSFDNCVQILRQFRANAAELIMSFEFMDNDCVEAVGEQMGIPCPLTTSHNFYLLIEFATGSNSIDIRAVLESLLAETLDRQLADDAIVAVDGRQEKAIWSLRENAFEAAAADPFVYNCDVSLPLLHFYGVIEATRQRLSQYIDGSRVKRVTAVGHMGDGNMHINIGAERYDQEVFDCLYPWLYEWVIERKGSISAEHGIGLQKRDYLKYARSPEVIDVMRSMKQSMDPNGILNPGKVLPSL